MTHAALNIRWLRTIALAGTSLMLVPAALAQDAETPETIVVTGAKLEESLPRELQQYGSRVEVITAEQISELGFTDTSQVLQYLVPGLYLAPKNGAFDYVSASLQGSRNNEILWLVDGVRISNRLYNNTSPLDTIPANMIERIEVLKGGQGLFYGTQSVGGVVNIITKGFRQQTDGAFEAGVDTNDGRHINGYTRGSFGKHQFVLFASHDEADGFQPFQDEDYQPSATDRERGYDISTFGGKYGIDFSEAVRFSASYQHTEAKLDFASAEDTAIGYNDRDEDIVSAKLDVTPSDTVSLFVKGYYHDWDTAYTKILNDLDNPGNLIVSSDAEFWGFTDYGVNVLSEFHLNKGFEYLVGYDYQRYNGRDEVFLIDDKTEYVHAFFGQIRTTEELIANTRIALGVRTNIAKGNDTTTVWNLSAKHDFSDDLFLRGMVGTSFRLPDAYELYVVDPCCEQGNPDLVGEESTNFEAGLGGRFAGGRVTWEAIGFYREVENLIKIVSLTPTIDTLENTGDVVKVKGGELVVTAGVTGNVSISLDFTHSQAREKGSTQQIQDIPKDQAKLLVDYRPQRLPIGLSAAFAWVGTAYDSVGGGVGMVERGDYIVTDLSGFWYLDSDEQHRISFRLENAFDEEYATSVQRVRRDTDGSSYGAGTRGTPRTLHVNYRFSF